MQKNLRHDTTGKEISEISEKKLLAADLTTHAKKTLFLDAPTHIMQTSNEHGH